MQAERCIRPRLRAALPARGIAAAAAFAAATLAAATPAVAGDSLDRIKSTGHIKLGYLADARPFSFRGDADAPDGYAIELCKKVAAHITRQLALPGLTPDWKPIKFEQRLPEVQQGNVDLLCVPTSVTLRRRALVSFSIPIFAGGNRAIVRTDAPPPLRKLLSTPSSVRAVWRGTPAATLLGKAPLAVVSGTTTEQWLKQRRSDLQIDSIIVPVPDYRRGLQQLLDGKVDVFFGDRVAALGALTTMDDSARENVEILDRLFTHEPAALALPRDDEDLRLLVDAALSRLYPTEEFSQLYTRWCGEFNEPTRSFFLWNTLAQ